MKFKRFLLASLILGVALPANIAAEPLQGIEISPAVVISEIQVANEEFIELYNGEDFPIQLDGWRLEYRAASKTAGWTTKPPTLLTGQISAKGYYLIALASHLPYRNVDLTTTLSNTGGHARLVSPGQTQGDAEQVLDLVGWGTAQEPEYAPAPAPGASFSIQRCLKDNLMIDTDDNATDFSEIAPKTPGSAVICPSPPEETPPPVDNLSCQGVVISELLPNAAGSDTGQEFIEIYNPTTDFIDIAGCGLQLSGEDHIYRFESQTLAPEEYRAFSDSQTGITLPNSSGGSIYLLSAADEELHTVTYPGDLSEQVAWAWFGADDWQQTYTPSPNSANVAQSTEPCPTGQVRSEESGRCINTSTATTTTGLKPCDPGQERNPDTNRCRAIATAESTLAACKVGQERNPETNRCRSVASATSQLKPCEPGQERNPETNRCRKATVSTGGSDGDVQDVQAANSASTNWLLAGIAATGAAGYGLWEWRRDIAGFVSRVGRKVTSTAQ